MNREPMSRAVKILVAACLVAVTSASGSAVAQCSSANCNVSNHHWGGLGYTSGSDGDTRVGMWEASPNQWYPTMCRLNPSTGKYMLVAVHQTAPAPYSTPQLTDHTSICMGGGDERISDIITSITCWLDAPGGSITVEAFDNDMFDLKISGEGGNDRMDFLTRPGTGVLCGSSGNDHLYGGHDYQYVSGGNGHDSMSGGAGNDTVRGGDGDDVLHHGPTTQGQGTDWLRGENDADCFQLMGNSSVGASSTCGSGADSQQVVNGSALPASMSCETVVPAGSNCCSVSPAC